jgi:hypothetical protein
VITNEAINMPWGNMATVDGGDSATIFVSNAGFGVGSPDGDPRVVNEQTVLRIKFAIKNGEPPSVVSQTVVGSGFGGQPNKDVFLIGPTGLALAADGTLYVSKPRVIASPRFGDVVTLPAASARYQRLKNCQAAATAVRHVSIAAARSVRCVWAEVRWLRTLKVL